MSADQLVTIVANGRAIRVRPGTSVAVALLNAGIRVLRRSVTGEGRGPLCGMGICFECRVSIDGVPHQRACLTEVVDGLTVRTDVQEHA